MYQGARAVAPAAGTQPGVDAATQAGDQSPARSVPDTQPGQRSPYYNTDRTGSPPRSGINSDPNNPNGAPGSPITPNLTR